MTIPSSTRRYAIVWFVLLCLTSSLSANDWPQWLGPQHDGSTRETIAVWQKAPKEIWQTPVGEGHSSPVVANGKVFLHVKAPNRNAESVLCFDIDSGKKLWETTYDRPPFTTPFGNGPRGTPTVVGDQIVTLGSTGILSCFAVADGKQRWQVDTLKTFSAKNLFFGISASPLVVDDKVLVNVGGQGAGIVAFTLDSGEVQWQATSEPASYATPSPWPVGDAQQVVFLTGANLLGISAKDGKVFWKFPFRDPLNESSTTPCQVGDVLIGSSVKAGGIGLRMQAENGQPMTKPLWKDSALTCYFSTPVAVGKTHAYVVTGEATLFNASATLQCVEAETGKVLWKQPKVGSYHASLLRLGDGKMLMLEDDGELVLLSGKPGKYAELARSKVCGDTWAHPALADGRLYLRDGKVLKCLKFWE